MACVLGVLPVCYIAVTCVTVFRTIQLQNHFSTLGLKPLALRMLKTGLAPSPPWEAGLASNPEGMVARVPGAFQVCSLPLQYALLAWGHNSSVFVARSGEALKDSGNPYRRYRRGTVTVKNAAFLIKTVSQKADTGYEGRRFESRPADRRQHQLTC